MLRMDLMDGLLVWLIGDEARGTALVLDCCHRDKRGRPQDGFDVILMRPAGPLGIHHYEDFPKALMHFNRLVQASVTAKPRV
jgi:hypothetical protein